MINGEKHLQVENLKYQNRNSLTSFPSPISQKDLFRSWDSYAVSVLPRLRFCAIVPQNFEYDAAKTVPAGHLAHIDFGLSQDFESVGCVENSHAKNNIIFHRNSRSCNGYFDWCIGFLNCTGTSVQ